jgi:imidazolonepropionase-like amidohydrolase
VRRIHRRFDPPLLKILHDELPPGAPVLKPEVLAAAVDEAHRLGMRAVVHAASPARWREVVESGADLLLHAVFSAPLAETEIEYFTARDLPFVPTLRAVAWPTDLARGEISDFERATIAARRIEAFRQPPAHWDWDKEAGYADLTGGTSALAADNTVRLARAGVPFFAGTDGGVPGVFPGAGLHRELALYVDLGLAPEEVLRAATSRPAAFLDPEGASGRVLPGYRADLLLVHGDPTTDIRALDRVALVCVSGDDATRCLAGE